MEIKCGDYVLSYNIINKFINGNFCRVAEITQCLGNGTLLEIPDGITLDSGEKICVSIIGRKACLGNGYLIKIKLPLSITMVDNWAFAQCKNLKEVIFPKEKAGDISFGKGVFDDCTGMQIIGDRKQDFSYLLGIAVSRLRAEYLLTSPYLGKEKWYGDWDKTFLEYLNEDDEKGYADTMLCGEEDIQSNMQEYLKDRARQRAGICYMRLLYDSCISAESRSLIEDYILKDFTGNTLGQSWYLVLEKYGDIMSYFQLLTGINAVTKSNIDELIDGLRDNHPETKAYLLEYKNKHFNSNNVFDAFAL